MLEQVGGEAKAMINARGRSAGHVLEGLALCAAAVVLTALVAAASPARRSPAAGIAPAKGTPPRSTLQTMWPALFLVLTLSGLRVWNAPRSRERSQALGFWAAVQALNALWMAWSPRLQGAQLATAAASLGAGMGYANAARKVDPTAAALVSPYLGWSSFAGLITGQVWTRNRPRPTVH